MLQLELAFDTDMNLYKKHDYCEGLKAVNSFCTVMLCTSPPRLSDRQ